MEQNKELVEDGMISNTFTFIFERGEHKGESYNVFMTVTCDNPLCDCGEVAFFVKDISNKENNTEYTFYLDVIKRKIGETSRIKKSAIDINFAKSFIKDINDENWQYFYSFFYAYKRKLTKKINNIDDLDIDFSLSQFDIEQNGTMTGYKEIFPFSEDFIIEYKDKKYLIYDQYCLSSNCNCKQAALAFIEYEEIKEKNRPDEYAIFYNYLKKQWISDVISERKTPENKDIIDAMKKQIPDINSTLKERHKTLRRVYANFTEKQENEIQKKINTINKVGRNAPCPCGSGKKYKKCCGR